MDKLMMLLVAAVVVSATMGSNRGELGDGKGKGKEEPLTEHPT